MTKQVRIPSDLDPKDLIKFSKGTWEHLTPTWNFWVVRWKRTLDFLRSQHWVGLRAKDLQKQPRNRRYPVFDYTLNYYNDMMGRFLQGHVRYSTAPASQDPEDISAADMADAGLAYSWDILLMDQKRIELAAWLLATGNAATRTYWDTDTGRMIPLAVRDKEGKLIPWNPATKKPDPSMGQPIMVDAGEIGLDVLSPQMVRWPRSKKQGVLVGMLMTQDEVEDRYGGDFAEILTFSKVDTQLDLGFLDSQDAQPRDAVPRALVIEHYVPRSKKFPQGVWWTLSGDHLLTQPRKLPAGVVPITKWEWVPLPGSKIAATPLYGMTFANKMIDELSGKMWEWANRVVPKQLLAEGGGIEIGEMDDEVAQQVAYNPGGEPQWTVPPPVPEHLFHMRNEVIRDMAMSYELARPLPPKPGQGPQVRQPTGPAAGTGSDLATLEFNTHASWTYQGQVILSYMKTFYTPGRMIYTVGPDKLHQWRAFSQIDLQRLPTTVHVDKQSLFYHNRQANRDTLIGLMASPASTVLFSTISPDGRPTIDKDRIETAMQATGIDVGISDLDPDVAEARNEHALLQNGQPIEVLPHQDHPTHIEEHERLMKGMSYRAWPDEAKQILQKNVEGHKEALQQEQQRQQQQMLETERMMREIRGQADSAAKVRTALGEEFAEMFGDMLRGVLTDFFKEDDDGKKAD